MNHLEQNWIQHRKAQEASSDSEVFMAAEPIPEIQTIEPGPEKTLDFSDSPMPSKISRMEPNPGDYAVCVQALEFSDAQLMEEPSRLKAG